MIQVQDGQTEIPSRRELLKDMEKADGIGAAGYCDAHPLARRKHRVALDGGGDALEQAVQCSHCTGNLKTAFLVA